MRVMICRLLLVCAVVVGVLADEECKQYSRLEDECVPNSITNCDECDDPKHVCLACPFNHVLTADERCLPCTQNCVNCRENPVGQAECTQCSPGFYLVGNQCQACSGSCDSCNAPAHTGHEPVCATCAAGRRPMSDGGKCNACGDRCQECSVFNTCLRCPDGFYISGAICVECVRNCDDCQTSMANGCDRCRSGTYFDGTECADCPNNCATCDGNGCVTCNNNFFKALDGMCRSAAHCAEYADNTGCTSCDQNYRIDPTDNTCYSCPYLDSNNIIQRTPCETCTRQDGRGQVLVGDYCGVCMDNCASCVDQASCQTCQRDFYYDDQNPLNPMCKACNTLVGSAANTIELVTDCHTCKGFVDSTNSEQCTACPSGGVDMLHDNAEKCTACPARDDMGMTTEGHFYADGRCEAATCSAQSTMAECGACAGWYWDNVCTEAVCNQGDDPSVSGTSAACVECGPSSARPTFWKSLECVPMTDLAEPRNLCNANMMTDEYVCTRCQGHMWDSMNSVCRGIDCDNADQTECASCPEYYWESQNARPACVPVDCSSLTLTQEQCYGCSGKIYENGACATITFTCDQSVNEQECYACAALESNVYSWDGSACNQELSGGLPMACGGSLFGTGVPDEWTCKSCRFFTGKYDAGDPNDQANSPSTCTAIKCDATTSDADCPYCSRKGLYVGPGGTCQTDVFLHCLDLVHDRSNTDAIFLSTEAQCTACSYARVAWDPLAELGAGSCVKLEDPDCNAADIMSENICLGCSAAYIIPAHCTALDCNDQAVLDSNPNACQQCGRAMVADDQGNDVCTEMTTALCTDGRTLTQEQCNLCTDHVWEGNPAGCVHINQMCSAHGIINSAERCARCSTAAEPKVYNTMDINNDPIGQCFPCPTNSPDAGVKCLSCDANRCYQCSSGYYWDETDLQCKVCPTPADSTEAICNACPQRVWEGQNDAQCNSCPENCLSCDSSTTCQMCVSGMSWHTREGRCVDCWLDSEAECHGCVYGNAGPYYNNALCGRCSVGCRTCPGGTCTECMSGYFMQGSVCEPCATPYQEPECNLCSSRTQYWNVDTCTDCGTNCQLCNSDGTCTQCDAGFFVASGACSPVQTCTDNCASCDQTTGVCSRCLGGHYENTDVNGDLACTACPQTNPATPTCAACEKQGDAVVCTACLSTACEDNTEGLVCRNRDADTLGCDKCKVVNNDLRCASCTGAYYWEDCQSCVVSGCEECNPDGTCTKCYDNYYMESSTRCTACDPDARCAKCADGPDSCTECPGNHATYTEAGNTRCFDCSSINLCSACTKNGNAAATCSRCSRGFLQEGGCVACADSHCSSCTSATECTECDWGYYMDGSGVCQSCSEQLTGCVECESDGANGIKCMRCESTKTLNPAGNECIPCDPEAGNCAACYDPPIQCTGCSGDFLPTEDCKSCDLGCYECGDEITLSEGEGGRRGRGRQQTDSFTLCEGDMFSETSRPNATLRACPGLNAGLSHCVLRVVGLGHSIRFERSCERSAASNCDALNAEGSETDPCTFIGDEEDGLFNCTAVCCSTHGCNYDVYSGSNRQHISFWLLIALLPATLLLRL